MGERRDRAARCSGAGLVPRVHRRAQRRDANEKAITAALLAAGATVESWDVVDKIVGYRGRTFLIEVTNPASRDGRAKERKARQAEWRARWRGHAAEVTTPEEALRAIGAL